MINNISSWSSSGNPLNLHHPPPSLGFIFNHFMYKYLSKLFTCQMRWQQHTRASSHPKDDEWRYNRRRRAPFPECVFISVFHHQGDRRPVFVAAEGHRAYATGAFCNKIDIYEYISQDYGQDDSLGKKPQAIDLNPWTAGEYFIVIHFAAVRFQGMSFNLSFCCSETGIIPYLRWKRPSDGNHLLFP